MSDGASDAGRMRRPHRYPGGEQRPGIVQAHRASGEPQRCVRFHRRHRDPCAPLGRCSSATSRPAPPLARPAISASPTPTAQTGRSASCALALIHAQPDGSRRSRRSRAPSIIGAAPHAPAISAARAENTSSTTVSPARTPTPPSPSPAAPARLRRACSTSRRLRSWWASACRPSQHAREVSPKARSMATRRRSAASSAAHTRLGTCGPGSAVSQSIETASSTRSPRRWGARPSPPISAPWTFR